MAAGRKAPPWRQRKGGAQGRRGVRAGLTQQIWFAASPMLLLAIGRLSSLTFGVVAVEVRAGVAGDGDGRGGLGGLGGLGGGSFGLLWGPPGHDESFRQGDAAFCTYHTELCVENRYKQACSGRINECEPSRL